MIPKSFTQQRINGIDRARLNQLRTSNMMPSIRINKNDPFNPRLRDPVRENTKVKLIERHTMPSKQQTLNPGDNNIALYDIRSQYSNMAEEELGMPILRQQLLDNKQDKIDSIARSRAWADAPIGNPSLRAYNINELSESTINMGPSHDYRPEKIYKTISSTYNPMLPDSETNKRPDYLPPAVDDRIDRKRNEREWMYESEQKTMALNLQNSEEVARKRKLEEKMHEANRGGNGVNRWSYDDKKTYVNQYQHKDTELHAADKGVKDDVRDKYAHWAKYSARETLDSTDIKNNLHLAQSVLEHKNRIYDDHIRSTEKLYKHKLEQVKKQREAFDEQKHEPEANSNMFKTIVDKVKDILGVHKKTDDVSFEQRNAFDATKNNLTNIVTSEAFQMYSKNTDHVKLVTNRGIDKPIIIDGADEYSNIAEGIISLDKNAGDKFQIKKTLAFLQDGKFIILQQQERNSIFGGDLNPVNDDLLVTVIPFEGLDTSFRQHVNQLNQFTETRARPLNLTYEDYGNIVDWIEHHPDTQQRMPIKTVIDNVRAFDYKRDIENSFSNDSSVFIDTNVKDKLVDTIRKHHSDKIVNRVAPAASTDETVAVDHCCCKPLQTKERTEKIYNINKTSVRSNKVSRNPQNQYNY